MKKQVGSKLRMVNRLCVHKGMIDPHLLEPPDIMQEANGPGEIRIHAMASLCICASSILRTGISHDLSNLPRQIRYPQTMVDLQPDLRICRIVPGCVLFKRTL